MNHLQTRSRIWGSVAGSAVGDVIGRLMTREVSPRTVIFSGVRWNFTWQRHHSIAAAAVSSGPVLFVEPMPRRAAQVLSYLRKGGQGDRVVTISQPIPDGVEVVGFARYALGSFQSILRLRRRPLRWRGSDRPDVALCYVPSMWVLVALWLLSPRAVVYDHVVDWGAAPGDWYPPRFHRWVEHRLARSTRSRSGAVITTDSAVLQDRWTARGVACTTVLPAADDVFLAAQWEGPDAAHTIGYFGGVRPSEISIGIMLRYAASGWDMQVVGPMDDSTRAELIQGGATCHHPVPNAELVGIVGKWDAVLLPYSPSPRLASLVPAKLFNAIATRRPVHVYGLSLPDELLRACDVATITDGLVIRYSADSVPTWATRWEEILGAVARGRGVR